MQPRTRNWCFTLNNPSHAERTYLVPNPDDPLESNCLDKARYVKLQLEMSPSGTPHFQGVMIMSNPVRLQTMKSILGRAHWEPTRDLKASLAYCEKEDTRLEGPWELGCAPRVQGARTDLEHVCETIKEGNTSVDEIALENPMLYHQYGRTFNKVQDVALRDRYRTHMTRGVWLWGPTGSGKSHAAFEGFHPDTHYVLPNDNRWCDGYVGQKVVIINDFRGHIPYEEMLQLVDKWPFWLPRRGREPVPFLAETVIVTSSLPPQEVYNRRNERDSIRQLTRRFEVKKLEPPCFTEREDVVVGTVLPDHLCASPPCGCPGQSSCTCSFDPFA